MEISSPLSNLMNSTLFDVVRIVLGLALIVVAVIWYREQRSRAKRTTLIVTALVNMVVQVLALTARG